MKTQYILNQTRTGKVCPRETRELRDVVPEGSLMCFVEVHAFTLATVLDRLMALEDYQSQMCTAANGHRSVG